MFYKSRLIPLIFTCQVAPCASVVQSVDVHANLSCNQQLCTAHSIDGSSSSNSRATGASMPYSCDLPRRQRNDSLLSHQYSFFKSYSSTELK